MKRIWWVSVTSVGLLGVLPEGHSQGGAFSDLELISVARRELVSVAGNGFSGDSVISADGRFVAFVSAASNLVTNDLNRHPLGSFLDVFVRELATGQTRLVSVTPDGANSGNGHSVAPGLSADGRYVVFESLADNLVPDDTNGAADVFVRDLLLDRTQLVSVRADGRGSGNGASDSASITPDGRFVVFESEASDLVAQDNNGSRDVFVRDLQSGVTRLVSVGAVGSSIAPTASAPAISDDGRYVAFLSAATGLVPGVRLSEGQIYWHDMAVGTTKWVSARAAELLAPFSTRSLTNSSGMLLTSLGSPVISADGRYVAFAASAFTATNILVLRYDAQTETTEIVGQMGFSAVFNAVDGTGTKMTPDGRFIAFRTYSGDDGPTQVQVWDAMTKTVSLVSVNASGTGGGHGHSGTHDISADGRYVTFLSEADDLLPAPGDGRTQVYRRDLLTGTTVLLSAKADGSPGGQCEGAVPTLSADGQVVAFESQGDELTPGDENQEPDVFVWTASSGRVALVSAALTPTVSAPASGASSAAPHAVSADGRYVVFTSSAGDLAPGDTNLASDVFVRDTVAGTTILVSVNAAGTAAGNNASRSPVISADGRFVAFASLASDLVPGDDNGAEDVFLRDLRTGTTSLVSARPDGASGDGVSRNPSMSADGRWIAFETTATDLIGGLVKSGVVFDVVVRDTVAGVTTLLSAAADGGGGGNRDSGPAVVSPDGRYVAFPSQATNLEGRRSGVSPGTFVRDLETAETIAVWAEGVRSSGAVTFSPDSQWLATTIGLAQPMRLPIAAVLALHLPTRETDLLCTNCQNPSLSAGGRFVAYERLTREGLSFRQDIEVLDRESGLRLPASVNLAGLPFGNDKSREPLLTPDGRFVLFESRASDLTPNDTNGLTDVFARDLRTGITLVLSRNLEGTAPGSSLSINPVLAGDGRTVVFTSYAANLLPGDQNDNSDVFRLRLNVGDSDADQLPDNWEWFHFGHLQQTADDDADQDGLDNATELSAGTDPTDPNSTFRLAVATTPAGVPAIRWTALFGRSYAVQYKNSLSEATWRALPFGTEEYNASQGVPDTTSERPAQRFYRVVIQP